MSNKPLWSHLAAHLLQLRSLLCRTGNRGLGALGGPPGGAGPGSSTVYLFAAGWVVEGGPVLMAPADERPIRRDSWPPHDSRRLPDVHKRRGLEDPHYFRRSVSPSRRGPGPPSPLLAEAQVWRFAAPRPGRPTSTMAARCGGRGDAGGVGSGFRGARR